MNKTFNIEYTAQIWQEGNQFIAHAMPLDIISSGDTPEEARGALDEAVQLFLETAADIGTLKEVLQEAGYEFKQENVMERLRKAQGEEYGRNYSYYTDTGTS